MKRHPWWATVEPVITTIDTGGEPHTVSWRNGKLVLHDHDLETEDVLLALGGDPCPCLLVRDAFRAARAESALQLMPMRVMSPTRGLRPATQPMSQAVYQQLQQLRANPGVRGLSQQRQRNWLAGARYQVMRRALPAELANILEQAGKERFARRIRRLDTTKDRLGPDQILHARVEPALREALRWSRANLRGYASLTVECTRKQPGDPPTVHGYISSLGGFVNLSLSVHWLNRVWLRGMALVDSYFVVDVDAPAPATNLRGTAIRWERRSGGGSAPVAMPCLLWRQDGDWHLAWA